MNIWKIATRWSDKGSPSSSIIDIFLKYNVLFAGRNQANIKKSVKPNDIIAVADGIIIKAIGKVLDTPKALTDFDFEKEDTKSGRFDYEEWVIGFRVSLFELNKEDWIRYRQGTFHKIHGKYEQMIKELFNQYIDSKFSINAKTFTFKYNYKNSGGTILNEDVKYVVPVYQRPYSWEENHIQKFISDIFRSFYGYDKETPPEPAFIGTMQFSGKRFNISENKMEHNIIDGQQRLTTFLVLLKVLKNYFPDNNELKNINLNWIETKVNNGEQNKFLFEFLACDLNNYSDENNNPYIKNALIVKEIIDELTDDEDNKIEFDSNGFIKHILSDIYFVVIETDASLSKTLQIFDAINTTGLDLNGGDLFKIRMYDYLKDKRNFGESVFSEINKLYAKIDKYNNERDLNLSIIHILSIRLLKNHIKLP